MRALFALTLSLMLLLVGCGPEAPPEDLGEIIDTIQEVPGSDKPFEMPQLDPPPATGESMPAADSSPAPAEQPKPTEARPQG